MAVVPVFVSSTFLDFHAERDVMRQRVRPLLDAAVAPYGCRVELVDLRWGVHTGDEQNEEEQRQQAVLDICFREIERARPLFVALLGDRFGWVPSWARAEVALRAAGIDPERVPGDAPGGQWSVTALEVWHGALSGESDAVLLDRQLTGEVPQEWLDADPEPTRWLRKLSADAAKRRNDKSRRRIQHLVVEARVQHGVIEPQSLATFEATMVDALAPLVVRHAERVRGELQLSAFGAAQRVAREDRELAIGRSDLVDKIVEDITATDPPIPVVVLTGASGVGKTTVWRAALRAVRDRGHRRIASVIVGVGPGSSTSVEVISRLAEELSQPIPAEIAQDPDSVIEWWAGVLSQLQEPWVVGIDGLDRLTAGPDRDRLAVMLRVPLKTGRLLLTTSDPRQVEILQGRGAAAIQVEPLEPVEVWRAAAEWGEKAGRQIPPPVLSALAGQARSGLWVRVAVDELTGVDATDFAWAMELEKLGESPEAALNRMLLERAQDLPDSDEELLGRVLDRVETTLPSAGAQTILGALGITRSGLTPVLLAALGEVDPLTVSRLRWQLGAQLRSPDPSGRLAPDHDLMRRALIARHADADPTRLHERIAVLLLPPDSVESGARPAPSGTTSHQTADPVDVLDALWHALHAPGANLVQRAMGATSALLAREPTYLSAGRDLILDSILDERDLTLRYPRPLSNLLTALRSPTAELGVLALVNAALVWDNFRRLRMDEHMRLAIESVALARRLRDAAPDDDVVRQQLAQAQWCLSQARLRQFDLASADQLARESLELRRDLLSSDPQAPRPRLELSSALYLVGVVSVRRGELPEALRVFEECRSLRFLLQADAPDNAGYTQALAQVLERLGAVYRRQHEVGKARKLLGEARTLRWTLAQASPWNAELSGARSQTLAELVELALDENDHQKAESLLSEWQTIAQSHVADSPGDATAERNLADVHQAAGREALARGDLGRARAKFEDSLRLVQRLGQGADADFEAQRAWARTLLALGRLKIRSGEFEAAAHLLRRSVDIVRPIRSVCPDDAELERELAETLESYGIAARCRNELDEAIENLGACLDLRRSISEALPSDVAAARALAGTSVLVGEIEEKRGGLADARDDYAKAISILLTLVGEDSSAELNDELDRAKRGQQRVDSVGLPATSSDPAETQLIEARWLARVASEHLNTQHRLATALDRIGRAKLTRGDIDAATQIYAEAHDLTRRLVSQWPDETDAATALVIILAGRAELALETDDRRAGRADYDEAQGRARRLLGSAPDDPGLAEALQALARVAERRGETETMLQLMNQARAVRSRADVHTAESDSPATREERIAKLQEVAEAAENNGDPGAAEEAWQQAVELQRRQVEAAPPDDLDAFLRLSGMLDQLGDVAGTNEKRDVARSAYAESLAIARRMSAGRPQDVGLQHDVVISQANLAIATREDGDEAGARRLWRETLAAARALAARQPDLPAVHQTLAKVLQSIARQAADTGRVEEARSLNDEAVVLMRSLLPGAEPQLSTGNDLVYTLLSRGRLALDEEDSQSGAKALAAAQEALALARVLVEQDAERLRAVCDVLDFIQNAVGPDRSQLRHRAEEELIQVRRETAGGSGDAAARADLALSLRLQGDNAMNAQDVDRAERVYREALDIYRSLAAEYPDDLDHERSVVVTLYYLADPIEHRWSEDESRTGDLAEAVSLLEEAVPLARRLVTAWPEIAEYRIDLAWILRRLSRLKEHQGARALARAWIAQAIDAVAPLTSQDTENAEYLRLSFLVLDDAADLAQKDEAPEARDLRARACDVARKLVVNSPGSSQDQERLTFALLQLAWADRKLGKWTAAQKTLVEARPLATRLVETMGQEQLLLLCYVLDTLADTAIEAGDWKTAGAAGEQLLDAIDPDSLPPGDSEERNLRTWSLERCGSVTSQDGLHAASFGYYAEAMVLRDAAVRDEPWDGERIRYLIHTMSLAAPEAWDAGGAATAKRLLRAASRLALDVQAGLPDPAEMQAKIDELNSSLNTLGRDAEDSPAFVTGVLGGLRPALGKALAEFQARRTA